MADPRWKATANLVVAGKAVKAGASFSAPAEAVRHAQVFGLVARDTGKRKRQG